MAHIRAHDDGGQQEHDGHDEDKARQGIGDIFDIAGQYESKSNRGDDDAEDGPVRPEQNAEAYGSTHYVPCLISTVTTENSNNKKQEQRDADRTVQECLADGICQSHLSDDTDLGSHELHDDHGDDTEQQCPGQAVPEIIPGQTAGRNCPRPYYCRRYDCTGSHAFDSLPHRLLRFS